MREIRLSRVYKNTEEALKIFENLIKKEDTNFYIFKYTPLSYNKYEIGVGYEKDGILYVLISSVNLERLIRAKEVVKFLKNIKNELEKGKVYFINYYFKDIDDILKNVSFKTYQAIQVKNDKLLFNYLVKHSFPIKDEAEKLFN